MEKIEKARISKICAFLEVCYLAEDLKCPGFKPDCPLFTNSDGKDRSKAQFNQAMDQLIYKAITKYTDEE